METPRRLVLAIAAAALVVLALAPPSWAQRARRTTTTTAPSAPGVVNAPPGSIINSWALTPAASSADQRQGDRSDFSYSAPPGTVLQDSLTLFNYSNVDLTFHIYGTDAFNDVDGHFDLLPESKKPTDVGTWVQLPGDTLILQAHKQATFPFSVKIPATARPGDHAGALLASNDAIGNGPSGRLVKVNRRTGSRIYVRVAGPLQPELTVHRISSAYHPRLNPFSGPVDVTYQVENSGNVRMGGQVHVTASGLLGLGSKHGPNVTLPELLPGQRAQFKAHFNGIPATLLASSRVQLEPAPVAAPATGHAASRGSLALALPLTLVAIGLVVFLVRYARRSYQRHEDEGPGPDPERQFQLQ